jgi:hypothetical protein
MLMPLFCRISGHQSVVSRREEGPTSSELQELIREGISIGESHPGGGTSGRASGAAVGLDMHSCVIGSLHLLVESSLQEESSGLTSLQIGRGAMRNVLRHRCGVVELLVVLNEARIASVQALLGLFDCLQDVGSVFGSGGNMSQLGSYSRGHGGGGGRGTHARR